MHCSTRPPACSYQHLSQPHVHHLLSTHQQSHALHVLQLSHPAPACWPVAGVVQGSYSNLAAEARGGEVIQGYWDLLEGEEGPRGAGGGGS
jgi:hypothetical protein